MNRFEELTAAGHRSRQDSTSPDDGGPGKVLIVVDRLDWALGTLAREYRDAVAPFWLADVIEEAAIRSHPITQFRCARTYCLVHFLTAGLAWRNRWLAAGKPAVVTVAHIDQGHCQAVRRLRESQLTVWLSMSSRTAGELERRCGVRSRVALPGLEHLASAGSVEGRERAIGRGEPLRIGFAGKASSDSDGRKGLPELIDTLGRSSRHANVVVWVLGEGWEQLIHRLRQAGVNVERCVRASSPRERWSFYESVDIYVCTSRVEGGPLPVLEALGCGCAVVSTRVGFVDEIISAGYNGYVCEVGDVTGLVAGTKRLIEDGGLRRRVRHAALDSARALMWGHARDVIVSAYRSCLDAAPLRCGVAWPFVRTMIAGLRTRLRSGPANGI